MPADQMSFARDVLRMIAIGIQSGHIKARDVEFLYSDGPKRVSVHQLAVEAIRALEQAACEGCYDTDDCLKFGCAKKRPQESAASGVALPDGGQQK